MEVVGDDEENEEGGLEEGAVKTARTSPLHSGKHSNKEK